MSPSLTPFQQAQQNFQTQLGQFDQFAQQGFPLSNFLTTSTPQQNAPSSGSGLAGLAGNVAGATVGLITGSSFSGFSISRLIAGLLGVLLIAGAIFIFGIEGIDAALDSRAGKAVKRAGEIFA